MSAKAEPINVCKICLEKDINSNLISPCLCKGSM
jgi:E3 ubiquitin-protein ligase DOA10